jgi:superfamily II DNA or RNA helicase
MDKYQELEVPKSECMTFGKIVHRPYQQHAFNKVIEHVKKSRDPAVVVASVGAGKTITIASLCKHVSEKNGKVLVLSRQGEIISQDADDCWLAECKNSIFSASLGIKSTVYPVILGSEGTVWRSLEKDIKHDISTGLLENGYLGIKIEDGKRYSPSKLHNISFDLINIDECHHVDFETEDSQYMKILTEIRRRNAKVRIIGLTGTDYRGVTPILPGNEIKHYEGKYKNPNDLIAEDGYFWRARLCNISTEYLTGKDYLVPCTFGFSHDDVGYDLSEFSSSGEDGAHDYTAEELRKMERKMVKAETTTEKIMIEVEEKTKNRNCVLITCAGKKHCKEAAKFFPDGSYAIITDEMGTKKRKLALDAAFRGEIKYLLQVGCLTTGVNIPLIDTVVILRKIGSLTLLVQLIGRGLRLLKDFQKDSGVIKEDCLVLDYSDTLNELKHLYDNPILENADFSKAKEDGDLIECPKCGTENSIHAVRCRGEVNGERCDFFWKSRTCEDFFINGILKTKGCGAENAPTSRSCRICQNTLIDPNDKLSNKHYKEHDYKPLLDFSMSPTKNNGVLVKYFMPKDEVAEIFYSPFSDNQVAKRIWYNNFVKKHSITPQLKKMVREARNAGEICKLQHLLDTVSAITHRKNDKGQSVISKFLYKDNLTKIN